MQTSILNDCFALYLALDIQLHVNEVFIPFKNVPQQYIDFLLSL